MINAAAFTGGVNVPSARFRVRQYLSPLQSYGVTVKEFISGPGSYPPLETYKRPYWGIANVLNRIPSVWASHSYDVSIIQREFLSTRMTLEPLTKRPRILDVDDAIWVHRGGVAAKRLAEISDVVVCGNQFLANKFSYWNRCIEIIPTAIDTSIYLPREKRDPYISNFVIGWIGTRPGFSHLQAIQQSLRIFLLAHKDAIFRVISDVEPNLPEIPASQFQFRRWHPNFEVKEIQEFDVGIMPLEDTEVARGKCAFKLLQYMSCAKPVIASPVGMNADVLALDVVGMIAKAGVDWFEALDTLEREPDVGAKMGSAGRKVVVEFFDTPKIAEKLAAIIRRTR